MVKSQNNETTKPQWQMVESTIVMVMNFQNRGFAFSTNRHLALYFSSFHHRTPSTFHYRNFGFTLCVWLWPKWDTVN